LKESTNPLALPIDQDRSALDILERRAFRILARHRSTRRKSQTIRYDEVALTANIIRLNSEYGRNGYRRIRPLLRREGCGINFI
jgi:hypothetical protein